MISSKPLFLAILLSLPKMSAQAQVNCDHTFNDNLIESKEFEVKLPSSDTTITDEGIRIKWVGQEMNFDGSHFKSKFAILGDFEVLLRFQVIQIGPPSQGHGAGVLMRLDFNDSSMTGISLQRQTKTNGKQVISLDQTRNRQKEHRVREVPISEIGECNGLKLTRKDATLDVYTIHPQGVEKRLWQVVVSPEAVSPLAFHLHSGGSVVDLEVVLQSFNIQASQFLPRNELSKPFSVARCILSSLCALLLVVGLLRRFTSTRTSPEFLRLDV